MDEDDTPIENTIDKIKKTRKPRKENKKKEKKAVVLKKRGRKPGKTMKKKPGELDYNPEYVIDFMIKSYPYMEIDKIKTKVLSDLKRKKEFYNHPNLLTKIRYEGNIYHYDSLGVVYDAECNHIGYLIDKKVYPVNIQIKSFESVINSIENNEPSFLSE